METAPEKSLMEVEVTGLHEVLPYLPFIDPSYTQLSSGPFFAKFFGVQFPHGAAWGSRSNLGFLGKAGVPEGFQLFAFSLPGSEDRWQGRLVCPDGLAVGNSNEGLEHRAGNNHRIVGWMFPLEMYLAASETLGLCFETSPLSEPWLPTDVSSLQRLLQNLWAHAGSGELSSSQLNYYEDSLIAETLRTLNSPSRTIDKIGCRAGLVKEVIEWLDDQAERTVSMTELCSRFQVHERTLRFHFAKEFDVSPTHYHRAIRLARARELLLSQPFRKGVVSQIATSLGFWHMGRFGQQYRTHFGETPSQTSQRTVSQRSSISPLFRSNL